MKEFFENLNMEKYHAIKRWLEAAAEESMAKELYSFLGSLEKSAAETYGTSFECPLPETKEITAFCNHCNEKFTLPWNLKKHGLEVHCPYCGEEIRLCACCPMDGECDYNPETGSCCYCHKSMTKEHTEKNFQTSYKKAEKKVEEMFSASAQEILKNLKKAYPKYWKKVMDYAQEYLQEKDEKEKKVHQETEWNTRMSYQSVNENGEKDYQEIIFPGLLTENQERAIRYFSRKRKFYPSIFQFPCKHEEVYQLLGFTKTMETPTTTLLPEEFVQCLDFLFDVPAMDLLRISKKIF